MEETRKYKDNLGEKYTRLTGGKKEEKVLILF
jgi:hypothetical protein